MKKVKKSLALLLVVMLLSGLLPVSVLAADEGGNSPGTVVSDPGDAEEAFESSEEAIPPGTVSEVAPEPGEQETSTPESATEVSEPPPEPSVVSEKPPTKQDPPPMPTLVSIGYDELKVSVAKGQGQTEYSIDGGQNWQAEDIFRGLNPGTAYSVIARYAGVESGKEQLDASDPSEALNVATVSQDTILVATEEDLRQTLVAINIVYGKTYNISMQNNITLTDNLVFNPTKYGATIYFDPYGFTLDVSGVNKPAIVAAANSKVVIGSGTHATNVDGKVEHVEESHGGTIKAHSGQTGIHIESSGELSCKKISITAKTAIVNHGELKEFSDGVGNQQGCFLENHGTVGDVVNTKVTQAEAVPVLDNYGKIGKFTGDWDATYIKNASDMVFIKNNVDAEIGELSGKYSNSGYYGATLISNYGTIGTLGGDYPIWTAKQVIGNHGTIKNIACDRCTISAWGGTKEERDVKAVLYNYEGGVIEEISSGQFSSKLHPIINYGTINCISGGKFCREGIPSGNPAYGEWDPENHNISNFGTINDVYGGWYYSQVASSDGCCEHHYDILHDWSKKTWFIVNETEDATYSIREGYQISYEPVTFADGTNSGDYRVVGPSRKIKWDMDGKLALISSQYYGNESTFSFSEKDIGTDINKDSELSLWARRESFYGQYMGSYEAEYVVGEKIPYYAFDHWDWAYRWVYPDRELEKSHDPGILIVDTDYVSFSVIDPNKKSSSWSRFVEVPKSEYGDLHGYAMSFYDDEYMHYFFIDSYQNMVLTNGKISYWNYSAGNGWSDEGRKYNCQYAQVANTGWKDQDGNLYVTDYATFAPRRRDHGGIHYYPKPVPDKAPNYFFNMPDKDLDMSVMYRAVSSEKDACANIWRRAERTTTSIKLNPVAQMVGSYNKNSVVAGAYLEPQISFDGVNWETRSTNKLLFENLTPNTYYDIWIRYAPQEGSKYSDWILPSEEIHLCDNVDLFNPKTYKMRTLSGYTNLPEALDFTQIAGKMYVTLPSGYEVLNGYGTTAFDYNKNSYYALISDGNLDGPDARAEKTYLSCRNGTYTEFDKNTTVQYANIFGSAGGTWTVTLKSKPDLVNNLGSASKKYTLNFLPVRAQPTVVEKEIGSDYITLDITNDTLKTGGEYSIKKVDGVWSDWQNSPTFEDLAEATNYEICVRLPATEEYAMSKYTMLTVRTRKPRVEIPAAPVLQDRTDTSVTVKAESGVEYSIDDGITWNKSGVFTGLTGDTGYRIVSRYAMTTLYAPSGISKALEVRTLVSRAGPAQAPVLISKSDTSIIIKVDADKEYSIDGGETWQTKGLFSKLKPNTEYEIISRFPETDTERASLAGPGLKVVTLIARPAPAEAPVLVSKSDTTIVIKVDADKEYSIDGGKTWNTDGTFPNLKPGSEYEIISRYPANDESGPSFTGPGLKVKTKDVPTKEIVPPVVTAVTAHSITIDAVKGQEYALQIVKVDVSEKQMLRVASETELPPGTLIRDWQDGGVFDSLTPDTKYRVITRLKETDDFIAGEVGSEVIEVKTKPKPSTVIPDEPDGDIGQHEPYILGDSEGTMRPESTMTRAEAAVVFARAFPLEEVAVETTPYFSDIDSNAWYYETVQQLAAAGFLFGYADGSFHPDAPITRAEFATLAVRFRSVDSDTSGAALVDVQGSWAEESILKAADAGWICGYPDNTFRPENHIIRAEAVSIINRMLARSPKISAEVLNGITLWPDCSDTGAWYFIDVMEASVPHGYQVESGKEIWKPWSTVRTESLF